MKLENVTLDDLGKAKRVVIDRDNTTIIGGGGDKDAIEGRCQRDPQADREDHLATTTGRSSRSGWRSWPAAWP